MRSEPNSLAWASANEKAFSLGGISVANRMVEGFVQPGFNTAAIGNSLRCVQRVSSAMLVLRCHAAHEMVIQLTLTRCASSVCGLRHSLTATIDAGLSKWPCW